MVVRVLCLGILLAAALLANRAEAASFDCGKASTAVEKTICGDGRLSSLDDELQKSYQAALDTVKPSEKPHLIAEQRNWIKYVRNVCENVSCLGRVYGTRIALLAQTKKYVVNDGKCTIPFGSSCRGVVYYRDPTERMDSFNKKLALHQRGTRIIGCDRLIDLPVGYANSNHSFGGYCTTLDGSSRSRVMICDDEMIGHFAMQQVGEDEGDDKKLIDFTDQNCFGG
jgi:uncharacterized protein YecT (DUF1311 family)